MSNSGESGQNRDVRGSVRPARSLLMIQLENERRLLEVSSYKLLCISTVGILNEISF